MKKYFFNQYILITLFILFLFPSPAKTLDFYLKDLLSINIKTPADIDQIYDLGLYYFDNTMFELADDKFQYLIDKYNSLSEQDKEVYYTVYSDALFKKFDVLLNLNKIDQAEELLNTINLFIKYNPASSSDFKKRYTDNRTLLKLFKKWSDIDPDNNNEQYLKSLFFINYYKKFDNYEKINIEWKKISSLNIDKNLIITLNIEFNKRTDKEKIKRLLLEEFNPLININLSNDQPPYWLVNLYKYCGYFEKSSRKASYIFNNAAVLAFQAQKYEEAVKLFYRSIETYHDITEFDAKNIYKRINACYLKLYHSAYDKNIKTNYQWLALEIQQKLKLIE